MAGVSIAWSLLTLPDSDDAPNLVLTFLLEI